MTHRRFYTPPPPEKRRKVPPTPPLKKKREYPYPFITHTGLDNPCNLGYNVIYVNARIRARARPDTGRKDSTMKTVRFWKVTTPFVTRYFEDEAEADRFYNSCERASITTFVRRSAAKIAAIREMIEHDNAVDAYYAEEMRNLDANVEAWAKENREA